MIVPLAVLLAGVLVLSIAASIGQLAALYDIAVIPTLDDSAVDTFTLALLMATKATLAAGLFWRRPDQRWSVVAWLSIAVLSLLLVAQQLMLPLIESAADDGVLAALLRKALGSALAGAIELLIGMAYLAVGAALLAGKELANGYKVPLAVGAIALGIAMLLVFIDTLIHVSMLYLDLTLLLFALSTLPRRGSHFAMSSPRWRMGYVLTVLGAPLAVFLGHKLYLVGETLLLNEDLIVAIIEERPTDMRAVPAWDKPRAHVPDGATETSRHVVLNDAWFVSATHAYGVNRTSLLESHDGGTSWREIRKLRVPGLAVRFSIDGMRGWSGNPPWQIELTRDHGKTWRRIEIDRVFEQHTGASTDDSFFTNYSTLHLDPDSGLGRVVVGCRLFTTQDFAASWQMTEIADAKGKRICLAETPFALDASESLALATRLGSDFLYRRNPGSGQWEPLCGMGSITAILPDSEDCDDETSLPEDARAFLQQLQAAKRRERWEPTESAAVRSLLSAQPMPDTDEVPIRRASDGTRWIAAPGLLLISRPDDGAWTVRQHVPWLVEAHPLDEKRAVGWDETLTPYVSHDGGGVFRPVDLPAERSVQDIRFDSVRGALWMLLEDRLIRFDPRADSSDTVLQWDWDEEPDIDAFGFSHDGRHIWIHRRGQDRLRWSRDAGETWKARKIEPSELNGGGPVEIADVLCGERSDECTVALFDGRVLRLGLAGMQRLGRLPEDAAGEPGFLLTLAEMRELIFVPQEGRKAFVSDDRGATWSARALRARDSWSRPRLLGRGSAFVLTGADGAIIAHEGAEEWITVLPRDWEDHVSACASSDTHEAYLFDGRSLAWTLDGGARWRRTETEHALAPWCGLGGGHLWLQLDGMRVFRLQRE